AAVITNFSNFEKDNTMFLLIGIGVIVNLFMVIMGYFFSLKKDRNIKIHYMLNFPGYNIGSFSMPFLQSFFGPASVVAACMFDMGNAIMTCGGNYGILMALIGSDKGEKIKIKDIVNKLLHSIPFIIYLVMILISTFEIHIPSTIVSIFSTTGAANGFVAMLMLGLILEINIKKEYIKEVVISLIIRITISSILAFIVYFVLPLPLIIRQGLTLVLFSPTSALAPPFTKMCNGDAGLASFAGSISIIISMFIMTILIMIMGA
ncbi:MAG: AEC family transporter, partial [Anaerotignaceae bacterium]